jgi:iron(III) transport system permease protein
VTKRFKRFLPMPVPAAIGVIALLVLAPVAVVLWHAAQPSDLWQHVFASRLTGHLWQTIVLLLSVTGLAVLFGVPAAWHVSVHEFRGRRTLEWALLLPLAMPGFVAAIAYMDTFAGLVPFYVWVRLTFGIDAFLTTQMLAPWVFAVVVLAATLFPYIFLACRAAFAREAAGALEAAHTLGAGSVRAFFRVALPMARPAVAAGGSLVAMEVINDYGVVTHFGLNPLTPGIFRAWNEGHLGAAMRLALILMAVAGIALLIERWQRGRRRYASDSSEAPLARRRLGAAGTAWVWAVCGLPLLLGFLIPAMKLLRWAVFSRDGFDAPAILAAAGNSLGLAAGASLLIVAAAAFVAGGRRAYKASFLPIAERATLAGYSFPSALVAVGVGALVASLANVGFTALALSASIFGLMLAYFTRYLAVGVQPLVAAFDRMQPGLHEAARTLGAGPLRALARVNLPLARPALIAAAILAFIDVFKELPLTLVLRPFDFETLATLTFRLTDEGRIPEASLPALSLVACSLIGLIPLTLLLRGRPASGDSA